MVTIRLADNRAEALRDFLLSVRKGLQDADRVYEHDEALTDTVAQIEAGLRR